MSVKLRIWLLPISAALMFAIGILIVLVFSSRTSGSIDQLSKVSYPFLAASTKFSAQLESLTGVIQSAVAEGEKRRLDEAKDKAVAAIIGAAKTGKIGDGKVFVLPLEDVIRIRTDEHGDSAV